ncbi:MAG: type I-C CRISPR-associated protein Cas8c/Csd1, partial [Solobacterium sp.]|nr:type I-C CRISPR-associated protein Cas8c/Csd1 [Solobacterium sp.]
VMWAGNAAPAYSKFGNILIMGNMQNDLPLDQSELRKLTKDISRGEKVDFNGFPLDPKEPFFITGLRARKGRIQLDFYFENSFGEFIQNINLHYERMQLNDEKSKNLSPTEIIKETVRDIEKANRSLKGSLLTSVLKNTRYLDEIFTGVLNRIRKGPDKKRKEKSKVTNRIQKGPDKARYETTKVTTRKAQVLKMYLSKNSQSSKEVTGLEININAKSIGYQCGRLFAVLEKIQKDATNVENLSSKHFNAAMATPGNAFAKVLRLNQYYVKKLNDSSKIYYDRLIQEIMNHIPEFPKHLSQIEQGEFCLGYYHQKQELYKKKDNKEVENNA